MGSFAPNPSATTAAPLPPLPDLSNASAPAGGTAQPPGVLASILSGIAPIKAGVDAINAACKQIVQSGAVPGAEQICGQIVALATSLLPMAAQNAMQGQGAQSAGPGPMPPPPGGPAPMMGPQG